MSAHDPRLLQALCMEDLFAFVWQCFLHLHPGDQQAFIPNWHVRAICHALEGVARGECRRLLITVPPRHLKSICTAVGFAAWLLGRDPCLRIMVASYGHDLASRHSQHCRAVMESPFYRQLFPQTELRTAKELELVTTANGGRKAVSLGGSATGFGADILIIDDLMKAQDGQSDVERQKAKDYYEQTLFSRLNNKQTGRIISIQQRLHEDDPAGYLLEKGFEHLNLRAIAETDEVMPIGRGRVYRRAKGEALFPQQEPLETLQAMRKEIGEFAFNAQYQQNPIAPGGNRIRWDWWGTYDEAPGRDYFQHVVQSWDTAMSAEPTCDFSVCTTWGYREGKWYLLDVLRQRLDYPDLRRELQQRLQRWRADKVIVERAGTGIPLIRELVRELGLGSKVIGYTPRIEKRARLEAQLGKLETGNFLLPAHAPWLADFRRECLAFPNGRNDDQVDSMAQFLDWLGWRTGLGLVRSAARPRRR